MKSVRLIHMACLSMTAGLGFAALASAEEPRPPCPAGVQGDWAYEVKTDTIRLEKREAPVSWTMFDGATETTNGYAVGYYWSKPWEGQPERLMDGEMNLQVGLYLLHPPQRKMEYGILAFSRTESDQRHDLDAALDIDGQSVLLPEDDGWNPQSTTSLYLSAGGKYDGPAMKTAFEEGGHTFDVTVWFKRTEESTPADYGKATLVVDSVSSAIEALRPVMAAEKARQAETGIWCQPTTF
ncbi:hypothetical protein [Henriciella litoralis]|uniref:hypothetical protein n=1 Tax=Henriciella litoralis TaxID=568102 RepID=UPI000A0683B6|nr:hypothetical protein [Henriciella litoralis]